MQSAQDRVASSGPGELLTALSRRAQCGSFRCKTVSTASVRKGAMTRRRASTATLFSLQNEERREQSHRFSGRFAYGEGISERNPASKIDQHRSRSTSGRCWAAADSQSSAAKGDSLRVTPLADEKKVRSFTACYDVYAGSPDSGVVQNGSERSFRSLCGRIRISLARSAAFWTFWAFSTSRLENIVDAADLS